MSHLPLPEGGGDKGGDLTTNSPTPGVKLLDQIAHGMPVKEYEHSEYDIWKDQMPMVGVRVTGQIPALIPTLL